MDQIDLQGPIGSAASETTHSNNDQLAQTSYQFGLELDLDNFMDLTRTHNATTDEHTNAIALPSKHRGVTPHNAFRYCWTGSRSVGCFFSQTNATVVLLTNQAVRQQLATCNLHRDLHHLQLQPLQQSPMRPPCSRSHCNPAIASSHLAPAYSRACVTQTRDTMNPARQGTIYSGTATRLGGNT